jgi:uncharacterized protein YjaZ
MGILSRPALLIGAATVLLAAAGFTIGYHIVKDYRQRHPHLSWAALTRASATTILTGSYYHPCTEAMN